MNRPSSEMVDNAGFSPPGSPGHETDDGTSIALEFLNTKEKDACFELLLMEDTEYDENNVVMALMSIVDMEFNEATTCFRRAQESGSAVVCVVCGDCAEFFAKNLQDVGIKVDIVQVD